MLLLLLPLAACNAVDAREPGPDPSTTGATASAAAGAPNAVVVVVDDMDDFSCADTAKFLPKSSTWLRRQGTCYENASVTSPVCCPARGQLVTGQMPHNNGVERQIDARRLRVGDTLQHALGEADVATYGAGKYLNGVNAEKYHTSFDTGFDDFDFWNGMDFWGYDLVDDEGRDYQPSDRVHGTVRVGNYVDSFIRSQAGSDEPFYAYAAFHAPHTQNALADPSFREWLPVSTPANAKRSVPRFRYRPERDTSDKLGLFHGGRLTERQYRAFWTARVRSLYDVDDQVARFFTTLERQGDLDDTVVFFVSDNGYLLGENGWEGKAVPYPGSVEVPMLAYYPDSVDAPAAGTVDRRPVGLVDIAPTLYDVYGLEPDHRLDGQSLLTSFRRHEQYHEFTNERSSFVLKESGWGPTAVPSWRSLTRRGKTYIEFRDHAGAVIAREFYTDARMERNLLDRQHRAHRPGRATLTWFRQELHRLRTCAGTPGSGASNPCP